MKLVKETAAYHVASLEELEAAWQYNIDSHPGDARWVAWRKEYIAMNQNGMAETWVAVVDGEPVGEGTLLFSPEARAIGGQRLLADGETRVNLNALRMRKPFEGQGIMSAMVKKMEASARERGYRIITIGVDECEKRNRAIYDHWGYCTLLYQELDEGELVLYYAKEL